MRNIARRVMRVRKTHRETLENAQEARAGLTKSTALLSKRRDVAEVYAFAVLRRGLAMPSRERGRGGILKEARGKVLSQRGTWERGGDALRGRLRSLLCRRDLADFARVRTRVCESSQGSDSVRAYHRTSLRVSLHYGDKTRLWAHSSRSDVPLSNS